MISPRRMPLHAPSEWDVLLAPELAPLFVLDAAIIAALRILSIQLDPSSSGPGGAQYPPTRRLLDAMARLREQVHEYRREEERRIDDPRGSACCFHSSDEDEEVDIPSPPI